MLLYSNEVSCLIYASQQVLIMVNTVNASALKILNQGNLYNTYHCLKKSKIERRYN